MNYPRARYIYIHNFIALITILMYIMHNGGVALRLHSFFSHARLGLDRINNKYSQYPVIHTVCPRSSGPFYIVIYYIKWGHYFFDVQFINVLLWGAHVHRIYIYVVHYTLFKPIVYATYAK